MPSAYRTTELLFFQYDFFFNLALLHQPRSTGIDEQSWKEKTSMHFFPDFQHSYFNTRHNYVLFSFSCIDAISVKLFLFLVS